MECSCINDDIDDPVQVLVDKTLVARKDYECAECRETIPQGAMYRSETFVYDGCVGRHKSCSTCSSVREEMFCSFTYGEIWMRLQEEIRESDGSMAWSRIARLIPEARAKVCDLVETYWEEEE